jgi:hypothetical protein
MRRWKAKWKKTAVLRKRYTKYAEVALIRSKPLPAKLRPPAKLKYERTQKVKQKNPGRRMD